MNEIKNIVLVLDYFTRFHLTDNELSQITNIGVSTVSQITRNFLNWKMKSEKTSISDYITYIKKQNKILKKTCKK